MVADALTMPASATVAILACRGCERPLFMAVVRCPYCGVPTVPPNDPAAIDGDPQVAPAVVTGETSAETPDAPGKEDPATTAIGRKRSEPSLSSPFWAVVAIVILAIGWLVLREQVEHPRGAPRLTQTIDTEWQPLRLPEAAVLTADGPFRLRSGPDLYAVPMDVGVAMPAPADDQPLEVRAVAGTVRLEIRY